MIFYCINNILQKKSCNVNLENSRHPPQLVFKETVETYPKLTALIENAFASFAELRADALFIGIITFAVVVCNKKLIMYKGSKDHISFC